MELRKFKERNPKKVGIILFTISCILLISGVILYRTFAIFQVNENQNIINGSIEDPGDIYFAFYKDGNIQKEMPRKEEGYILDEQESYCGVTGKKDNNITISVDENNKIHVSGVTTSRTKCNLFFRNHYKVKVNEQIKKVSTTSKELTIEKTGEILLCNNGITAKEEEDGIHLSNITKDSTCEFYDTSNNALDKIDNSKNYMLFLSDETIQSTWTILETKEITIDLNGHTKNGTIIISGTLYLKSSNAEKGIIQGENYRAINPNKASHTEIENIKVITTNHGIVATDNSFVHIKNTEISISNTTWTPTGIILYLNSNVEVIDSKVDAPFGIIVDGTQNSLIVQNSNINTFGSTALQISSGIANVIVEGSCKISGTGNGYGIWSNSAATSYITLNMLDNQIPTISSENVSAIHVGYGVLNWQYGESYGKNANSSIQSVTLTRKSTTLTTESKDGMYYTYLK